MTRDLAADLERICLEQALERARRSRSSASLPSRVLAVTPCGEDAPELEVVAEATEPQTALARGCARMFSRSRFDTAAALVLIVEGYAAPDTDTRPSEHPDRLSVVLAVATTLEALPTFRASIVNASTLERLDTDAGDIDRETALVQLLEKAASNAERFRAIRRQLGADAEG